MNVHTLEYDRAKAADMVKLYRQHKSAQTEVDAELERIYYQISRGKKVIAALQSIVEAGLGPDELPRLAICPADWKEVYCDARQTMVYFGSSRWTSPGPRRVVVPIRCSKDGRAIVPMIPIHLRPKAALHNYHILWEADWKAIPVDPMLLRRIGKDAWVVLAAWDLTDLERSVLAARLPQ